MALCKSVHDSGVVDLTKPLILIYEMEANLYVANAVIRRPESADWRFYYGLTMQCYFDLAAYCPFTRAVLSGLLSMVVTRGLMRLDGARIIYNLAEAHGHQMPVSLGVPVIDQDTVLKDLYASQVETLAEDLTSRLIFDEFVDS